MALRADLCHKHTYLSAQLGRFQSCVFPWLCDVMRGLLVCLSTKAFVVLNRNRATNFKPGRLVHLFRWSYMPLFGFTNLTNQVLLSTYIEHL